MEAIATQNKDHHQSAIWLLVILASSVFLIEILIMVILPMLPTMSDTATKLLDAFLLSVLLFPIFYFLVFRPLVLNINLRAKAEDAVRESETRFRNMADHAPALIWMADAQNSGTWYNQQWLKHTGRTMEQELGFGWLDGMHPDDRDECATFCQTAFDSRQKFEMEFRLRSADGTYGWVADVGTPRFGEGGEFLGYIGYCWDITGRKKMEEQVRQLAYYDTLTNLPNRRLLNDRLGQCMVASKRTANYGAVMFLDLDNFKPLNDTHGHVVGDLLLIDAATRLKSCVREMDTVARFGGDEFVVMLRNLVVDKTAATSQARLVAEKILAALSIPYLLTVIPDGQPASKVEHLCTASIGVAMFVNHEGSQDDILKWADAAMYQAKEAGRNSIRFYVAET